MAKIRRDIKIGIKNLFIWFPIIWKDKWWDYSFLLKIIRFKIELMEKNFRENACYIGAEKDADVMKLCIYSLNRIISDDYHSNAFKRHDKKWGDLEMKTIPVDNITSRLEITAPNVTEENKSQYDKEFKRCSTHAWELKRQDLEFLFNTLIKNIERWWD